MKFTLFHIVLSILSTFIGVDGYYTETIQSKNQEDLIQSRINTNSLTTSYDVTFYWLDLSFSDTSTYLSGNTKMEARALIRIDEFAIQLEERLHVDSVFLNGQKVDFIHEDAEIKLEADPAIQQSELFETQVFYHGYGYSDIYMGGVFNDTILNKGVTWTISESFSAKSWFPCKEDLLDKADSVYVDLTVPEGMLAGSNGLLHEVKDVGGGMTRFKWRSFYPVAYYLISASVGYYRDYTIYAKPDGVPDSFPVVNYIYDDDRYFNENKGSIDRTLDLIDLYSVQFGLYPFHKEKYGHCVVTWGGGMEHQTMTTLGSFNFRLVAHELAHQWFGDHVTCASWQDIWINEGFASYSEYLAYEALLDPETTAAWLSSSQEYVMSQPDGSVYIPEEDATNEGRIFDYRLSYRKGACIIHMIRHELQNDSQFFEVLRTFQNRFSHHVAIGEDFRAVLEEVSGKSFERFFQEWYYGEGYPIMNVSWSSDGGLLRIVNNQTTSMPGSIELFEVLVPYYITYLGGDTTILVRQQTSTDTVHFNLPGRIFSLEVDPENYLLKQVDSITVETPPLELEEPFILYPNPSSQQVTIEALNEEDEFVFSVFDSNGQQILHSGPHMHFVQIPTDQFDIGMYIFHVESGGENYNMQFFRK